MILLYGAPDDPPLALLIEALQDAGAEYLLLTLSALDRDGPLDDGSRLRVAGRTLPLAAVSAVYARPLALPGHWSSPAAAATAARRNEAVMAWLDSTDTLVVNPPRAMLSNGSKPLQIQLIGEAGFTVPETLVTSSEAEARAFWRCHGRVVYKSISGVRSIVHELDDVSASRLPLLRDLPLQLQAHVDGTDLRVHVVGDHCFAARIESTVVDYRYPGAHGSTAMTAVELPAPLASRCVALAAALALPLAGIDLRLRPDGSAVCFEVNPMPAYSHFEHHTGQRISQALAALLIAAPERSSSVHSAEGA